MDKIQNLGQVWTPKNIVNNMLCLRSNKGRILEPSAGNGAFMNALEKDAIGIEIINSLTNSSRIIHKDFFDYSIE